MNRKLVLALALTLLVGTLSVALNVQDAKASGAIYIRADGSIDPPDAPVSTVDNATYTLTGNITSDVDGIVVERSNIVVDGADYTVQGAETGSGFSLAADNVTVRNTCVQKFRYGIVISSSGCTVINDVITYNVKWGVYLGGSDNRIISNRIANTGLNLVGYDIVGIYCGYGSDNNTIADNHIEENGYVGSGILLYRSSDNTITGNNITNHDYAGIYLDTLSGNVIYHNNFINNYYQVSGYYSANTWDGGYPSGGNYWSNYTGVDLKSGFYQNETGSDGIGDLPYVIDSANQDNYPLVHPWSSLPVHNMNTGLSYAKIQEAIDANETLNGHTIFAEAGTYYENVVVNKTVTLIGESRKCTVIDGNKTAEAVTIVSSYTSLSGFTVQSSDPLIVAMRVENVTHVIVVDNTITNSFLGLILSRSSSNTIAHNNISGNTFRNSFANSSDNILTDNTIDGLSIWASFNNTLESNVIGSFELSYSVNTKLRNNSISAFGVYGDAYSHFVHDIDSSNALLGKPVCYWVSREDAEVPSDTGYAALVNCMNITVRDLDLGDNYQGIMMFSTNNSRILNNNVTRTNDGIWVLSSSNNTISGNNITANNDIGVGLWQASNNTVSGNDIADNGIGIYLYSSSDCTCFDNNVANDRHGIYLYSSFDNRFFHNNFIGNPEQVYSSQSVNVWDEGAPSGGNYWSNYTGVDSDHDGMGDTPYTIDLDNTDNHPLMGMFSDFNATSEYSVQTICNSSITDFQSNGTSINFNVTGEDGTAGFCRLCIPIALMNATYRVFVNGTEVQCNLLPCSNSSYSYLYFTYSHSTEQIIIVPEFPSFVTLPLLMLLTMVAVVFMQRKTLRKQKNGR